MTNQATRSDGEKCYVNSHFETRVMVGTLPRGKRRLQPLPLWRTRQAKAGAFAYAELKNR